MKNIHVLQTDKPSRLAGSEYITNVQGTDKRVFKFKLWNKYIDSKNLKDVGYIPQHIYITNSEEIKEGDWYITILDNEIYKADSDTEIIMSVANKCDNTTYKRTHFKIILTGNEDLINDGVQTIDDEFLEWFVKNPSCESVEVVLNEVSYFIEDNIYRIVIPKEEPTEEAKQRAKNYMSLKGALEPKKTTLEEVVVNKFGEEDMITFLDWSKSTNQKKSEYELKCLLSGTAVDSKVIFSIWFEQFKKKQQ